MDDIDAGAWVSPSAHYDFDLASLIDFSWVDGIKIIDEWDGWDRPAQIENTTPDTSLNGQHPSTRTAKLTTDFEGAHPANQEGSLQVGLIGPSLPTVATAILNDGVDHSNDASLGAPTQILSHKAVDSPFSSLSHINEAIVPSGTATGHELSPSVPPVNNGNDTGEPEGIIVDPPAEGLQTEFDHEIFSTLNVGTAHIPPMTTSFQTFHTNDSIASYPQLPDVATSTDMQSAHSDAAFRSQSTTTEVDREATSPDNEHSELDTGTQIQDEMLDTNVIMMEGPLDTLPADAKPSTGTSVLSTQLDSTDPKTEPGATALTNVQITSMSASLSGTQTPEFVSTQPSHVADLAADVILEKSDREEGLAAIEQDPDNAQTQLAILNRIIPERTAHNNVLEAVSGDDSSLRDAAKADTSLDERTSFPDAGSLYAQVVEHQAEAMRMTEGEDNKAQDRPSPECAVENPSSKLEEPDEEGADTPMEDDEALPTLRSPEEGEDTLNTDVPDETVESSSTVGPRSETSGIDHITEADAEEGGLPAPDTAGVNGRDFDVTDINVTLLSQDSDLTLPPTPGPEEFELSPPHSEEAGPDKPGPDEPDPDEPGPDEPGPDNSYQQFDDICAMPLPFKTATQEGTGSESDSIRSSVETDDVTGPLLEALTESEARLSKEMKAEEEYLSSEVQGPALAPTLEAPIQREHGNTTLLEEEAAILQEDDTELSDAPLSLVSQPELGGEGGQAEESSGPSELTAPKAEIPLDSGENVLMQQDDTELSVPPASTVVPSEHGEDVVQQEQALTQSDTPEPKAKTSSDINEADLLQSSVIEDAEIRSDPSDVPIATASATASATPKKPTREPVSKSAARSKRQLNVRPRNPSSTKKKDKDFKFHSDGSDSDDAPAKKKRRKTAPTPKKPKSKDAIPVESKAPAATQVNAKKSSKSSLSKEISALLGDEKKHLTGEENDLSGTKRAAATKGRKATPQQLQVNTASSIKVEDQPRLTRNRKTSNPAALPAPNEPVSPTTKAKDLPRTSRTRKPPTTTSLTQNPAPEAPIFNNHFTDTLVDREDEQTPDHTAETAPPTRTLRSHRPSTQPPTDPKDAPKPRILSNPTPDTFVDRDRDSTPSPPKPGKPSYETPYGKRYTRADKKTEQQHQQQRNTDSDSSSSSTTTTTPAPKPKGQKQSSTTTVPTEHTAKRKTAPSSPEGKKTSPPSKRTRAGQAKKEEVEKRRREDERPVTRGRAGRGGG